MASHRATLAGRMLRVAAAAGRHRPSPALIGYPGLRSKPWYERDDPLFTPWLQQLESMTGEITAEYEAVRASGRPSDYRVDDSEHQAGLHSAPDDWHWASLIDRGRVQSDMWARCPTTAAALESVPGLCVGDMPFAFAFFSTLSPRTKIAPHTSPANVYLGGSGDGDGEVRVRCRRHTYVCMYLGDTQAMERHIV